MSIAPFWPVGVCCAPVVSTAAMDANIMANVQWKKAWTMTAGTSSLDDLIRGFSSEAVL